MRKILPLLMALVLAGCAGGAGGAAEEEAGLDFTAPTLGGGQLEGGSLEGRDVVLWFWAPW